MKIKLTKSKPINVEQWEQLCINNGNFLQSTLYDKIEKIDNQESFFLQIINDQQLVGGTKIRLWTSRYKFIKFYKRSSIFGEYIINKDFIDCKTVIELLNENVKNFITEHKVSYFSHKGFFSSYINGYSGDLLFIDKTTKPQNFFFNVAYLDLTKSEEDLFAGMHHKHRQHINKAIKLGIKVEENDNAEFLNKMLAETYKIQQKTGPNIRYVKNCVEISLKNNFGKVVSVQQNDEISASLFCQYLGDVSYAIFSGSIKDNNNGAGKLLHWEIIKHFKNMGCKYFVFGQSANEKVEGNDKFTSGITDFKAKFGCEYFPSQYNLYTYKPFACKTFQLFQRINNLQR